jgi:XTP/dITP diphosphohydrolase
LQKWRKTALFFDSLLLATANRCKYEEFLEILPCGAVKKFIFAPDAALLNVAANVEEVNNVEEMNVEETGSTYAANAYLKARAWACASELPSLGDDSGLEVEALSWRPGVFSARVRAGDRLLLTDDERNQWLLAQMEGRENRRARFVAALALAIPDGWALVCEGVCNGTLDRRERGARGFGYDPLFIPDGYDVSFGELSASVKNQISHRARAMRVLWDILEEKNFSIQRR